MSHRRAWEEPVPSNELIRPELAPPSAMLGSMLVTAPPLLEDFKPTEMPKLPEESVAKDGTNLPVVPVQNSAPEIPVPTDSQQSIASFNSSGNAPVLPPSNAMPPQSPPEEYQMRQAQNRLQLAMPFGADADSEAAVEAGLLWLGESSIARWIMECETLWWRH